MTPPHLVNKWVREVQDAIPGCQVEIVTDVDDTVTFMKLAEANPKCLHVMVLSREKAKLGEGWEPAILTRKRHIAQWPKAGPIPIQFLDPDTRQPKPGTKRIITQKQLCCPTCGQPIPSKKDLSALASRAWLERQPRVCYRCGAPLWQFKRRWSGPKPGEKFPRRNPRYPLARFLRERYADRIGVVAFDEIHELKGGGSDQGRAMHDLALVADKAIGLTGTLFGGVSSSLFWIEWAFNPRLYR